MSATGSPVLHAVGWALVHSLWQCAALALALRIGLRLSRSAPATHRYALACATLVLMLGTTAATAIVAARGMDGTAAESIVRAGPAPADRLPAAAPSRDEAAAQLGEVRPRQVAVRAAWFDEVAWRVEVERFLPWLVAAWLAGVALLSARLLGAWTRVRHLPRVGTAPAPEPVRRLVRPLARELRVAWPVEVLTSAAVHVPTVVGWMRPVILLPLSALTGIAPRHLELLLLHELAHVRRHDYLVNLLQAAAETLLFHHPAVWYVGGRIRAEREHCCDDVAARFGTVREYIAALATMEEVRRGELLAVAADGGSLLGRVLRLAERPARTGSPARAAGAAIGLLITALLAFTALGAASEPARGAGAPRAAARPSSRPDPLPAPATAGAPLDDACPSRPAGSPSTLCPALDAAVARMLAARNVDGGAVLVQDVATGAVLAYAASGRGDGAPLTAAAFPGSVWKLVLASLWWESGRGDDEIGCPASVTVGGRTVRNSSPMRRTLAGPREMLVYSCNTAAVRMALALRTALGAGEVDARIRRLGFDAGEPAARDTGFWATHSDAFRARMSPLRARTGLGASTPEADWADFALGTRRVAVSPLHVARFIQAIGNDGVMMPPTVDAALAGRSPGRRTLSPATAARLQDAMRDVVTRGTARSAGAVLAGSPWRLGGKTGTLPGPSRETDGWFAGLAFDASGQARYAVVVRLPGGGPGGGAPARLAARIVRMLPAQAAASRP
ncbi:MAG TPA: M56 family metallopeptidase [Longimicrobium sp.]|nr:M56 family metallopeptidase [Longimicrobium sp.]